MHAADAAGDFLRLVERYRQMKDPELLVLLRQSDGLTDLARQALEAEVHHRRLRLEPEPPEPPPPIPEDLAPYDPGASYEEDRKLVTLRTVWSLRDALKIQALLDTAGIPFFIGPEKATGVAEVTSNFSNGVDVQVMQIGIPWAAQAMSHYLPSDGPPQEEPEEPEEIQVRCPKCQSTEVVFNRLLTEPPPHDPAEFPPASADPETASQPSAAEPPHKFDWTCDACGYEWEDDGIAKE